MSVTDLHKFLLFNVYLHLYIRFVLESDSANRDSDTSDVPSDSVATCLPDGANMSQFTSTEVIAGTGTSFDTLLTADAATAGDSGGASHNAGGPPKVIMRTKRRNSERPWSVSCLSQLTQTETTQRDKEQSAANQGLANHSISESALHTLSTPHVVGNVSVSTSATAVHHSSSMKSVDSKNSLKRRRMRARKRLMVLDGTSD